MAYFIVWAGANFYAIFYLLHKAEVVSAEIYVFLRKKQELLNSFINKFAFDTENLRNIAFGIRDLKNQIDGEKHIATRLSKERQIDGLLDNLAKELNDQDEVYLTFVELIQTKDLIWRQVEKYNRIVEKLETLCSKKVISRLVNIFHVKKLSKI